MGPVERNSSTRFLPLTLLQITRLIAGTGRNGLTCLAVAYVHIVVHKKDLSLRN